MKLTQKQKAKVEKQLLTILPATLDEALKGLTNTERTYAAHLVRQVPKFGDEFAKCIETYAGYLGEDLDPTDRARNNVTPTFNRDDYIHWEPTTDPSLTYPQQLEVWRVEMLEKLAALQNEIQLSKDGLAANSRKKYVDGLRQQSADPRAMAAKRANESVIQSVKASLDRQFGRAGAKSRLNEAQDHAATRTIQRAKNYLKNTTK
jgi:hypothetical protein